MRKSLLRTLILKHFAPLETGVLGDPPCMCASKGDAVEDMQSMTQLEDKDVRVQKILR